MMGMVITDKQAFPTPVGMTRKRPALSRAKRGFPHTRGDDPLLITPGHCWSQLSPHPWG